jgi:1,2-phenylacetyl-CoA epoxidase catalytic subunit
MIANIGGMVTVPGTRMMPGMLTNASTHQLTVRSTHLTVYAERHPQWCTQAGKVASSLLLVVDLDAYLQKAE